MRGGASDPEIDRLSNIIQSFNDRYGTQFEDTDKVRRVFDSLLTDMSKSDELINSIKYSDDQNARITNDKILQQEFLKHITTNFDLYKLFSDNREFQEDLSHITPLHVLGVGLLAGLLFVIGLIVLVNLVVAK